MKITLQQIFTLQICFTYLLWFKLNTFGINLYIDWMNGLLLHATNFEKKSIHFSLRITSKRLKIKYLKNYRLNISLLFRFSHEMCRFVIRSHYGLETIAISINEVFLSIPDLFCQMTSIMAHNDHQDEIVKLHSSSISVFQTQWAYECSNYLLCNRS